MAGRAVVHDAGMTERCRQESRCDMADTAILVGRHMVGRGRLAGGRYTIVTGCAVACDAGVIEARADKCGRIMTDRAIFSGR